MMQSLLPGVADPAMCALPKETSGCLSFFVMIKWEAAAGCWEVAAHNVRTV